MRTRWFRLTLGGEDVTYRGDDKPLGDPKVPPITQKRLTPTLQVLMRIIKL